MLERDLKNLMPEQTLKDFVQKIWDSTDDIGHMLIMSFVKDKYAQLFEEQLRQTASENFKQYSRRLESK